jgi:hypothetical protein
MACVLDAELHLCENYPFRHMQEADIEIIQ